VSTDPSNGFDLDAAWELHPQVALRPERFGALLYHYGTRRLSFLKSPRLHAVLDGLVTSTSARNACELAGVAGDELRTYERALSTLAATDMIRERLAS
jgi:mycofactocin biosynthesis protein MftB